jgi:hypothetical protein
MPQATLPKSSFVVSFDEAEQKFSVFAIKDSDIEAFKAATLVFDWPLTSIGDELGEEVGRRLGITALNVLALYHPTLKPLVKVKLDPLVLPDDAGSPD